MKLKFKNKSYGTVSVFLSHLFYTTGESILPYGPRKLDKYPTNLL